MNTLEGAPRFHYLRAPMSNGIDEIGISISGGGVRAACLGLGALQVAEETGVLARTRYISAVSGGGYTATAFMSARAHARQCPPLKGTPPPWSRGSAEEAHLRRNLHYLGEDWSDLFLGAARYLLTLLLNLVPFTAVIVLGGCVLGVVCQATGLVAAQPDVISSLHDERRWAAVAVVSVLAVLVEKRLSRRQVERRVRHAAFAAVILLLLPDAIAVSTRLLDTRTFSAAAVTRLAGFAAGLLLVGVYVFRSQWSFTRTVPRLVLRQTLRFLFSTSMAAVFVLPLLLLAAQSSQLPYHATVVIALGALVGLLLSAVFVQANNTSLHGAYSRRLDRAYVVRTANGNPDGAIRLSDIHLSDMYAAGLPRLLICTSVNLREDESAEGEGCTSFVFSADYVGGPAVSDAKPADLTGELDAATVVAASGAAVAPNMGRYTGRASRIALALMNLRLGWWLRNPLMDRRVEPSGPGLWRRLVAGWREPGPLTTWREALGHLSIRHRYVFISDGGHWDNSGVVELLRRRCRTIFAVDASVDDYRLGNLLRTIALARSELGVEFEADGALLNSRSPVARIRFHYPDDPFGSPANYLILLRTHICPQMPSDLVALAASSGTFPRHSTLNQFLRAREVDAYVALGRWLLRQGLAAADLLPSTSLDDMVPAGA
jgi:hypothetical protein